MPATGLTHRARDKEGPISQRLQLIQLTPLGLNREEHTLFVWAYVGTAQTPQAKKTKGKQVMLWNVSNQE
jgi:hypothetical protein